MPTKLLTIVVAVNAVFGQLVLKHALATMGGRAALGSIGRLIPAAIESPWVYASVAIQAFGYLLWMILISREKLGVATAGVGAGFYLLMPICAWLIYGESLTGLQWLGMGLLTVGITLVSVGNLQ